MANGRILACKFKPGWHLDLLCLECDDLLPPEVVWEDACTC